MTDSLHELIDDLTKTVNTAFSSGIIPDDVFNAMAGVTAATAFALGAEDNDVYRLFTKFAYGFGQKRAIKQPIPKEGK